MPRQASKHYQNLLLRRAVFGMLVIGVVASLATLAPFYQQIQGYITDLNHAYADAQAQAIRAEVTRYQDISQQVSSRSEIRSQLEGYVRGEKSLADVRAYTQPRLSDAGRVAEELIAIVRIGLEGETIAEQFFADVNGVEEIISQQFRHISHEDIGFILLGEQRNLSPDHLILSVPSAITAQNGDIIGTDLLFFSAKSIARVA
ncbi:MAG: hypothetical protein M1473_12105, partial [Firmicutes bacterium]|nr:hypothetical protein [Bacillota bacterium]